MKIGIVGAGFTGLSAAYYLSKKGHDVTIIEKDDKPGGLAIGYKDNKWDWTLEKHYHHWFTNDKNILELAKEIEQKVIIKRPKTSIYSEDKIYQLDSPIALLKFSNLGYIQKIRMAMVLGFLKINPFWKPLEKIKADTFLRISMGSVGYEKIWEPQLSSKFGKYKNEISLAWFWARVKKRTPSLAYPSGGYLEFAKNLTNKIQSNKGVIIYNEKIIEIKEKKKILVKTNKKTYDFDKVIVTLPLLNFLKTTPQLPTSYKDKYKNLNALGAINIVLKLNKKFLKDNTYWLSICTNNSPVMAIVEHTNFMDKANYNNEVLVYLGNYLSHDHKFFSMNKKEILKIYNPFLKKINKNYQKNLIDFEVFKSSFAQPIISVNYSKMIPQFKTPLKNIYLANMQQVYPWDRGTNYAVELGFKISDYIINENQKNK